MTTRTVLAGIVALALVGCDSSPPPSTPAQTPLHSANDVMPMTPSLGSRTAGEAPTDPAKYWASLQPPSGVVYPRTYSYRGAGHQAGYDWAEENEIYDASDCGGNSQSFIEGCEEYADEHGSEDAGRQWAENNGVNDPGDCEERSSSFSDACREVAEERQQQDEEAAEDPSW